MTISTTQVAEVDHRLPNPLPERPAGQAARERKTEQLDEPRFELPDSQKLQEVLAESDISLNFRRDDETGRIIVELIDNRTGDAVRQIPSEVSLRLTEMFSKVKGYFFEVRV